MDLKMRLFALFLAVVCISLNYTVLFEIKPKSILSRLFFRIIGGCLYVAFFILIFYAVTVGLIS